MEQPDLPLRELNWPPDVERAARRVFRDEMLWPGFKSAVDYTVAHDPEAGQRVQSLEWKALIKIAQRFPNNALVTPGSDSADVYWLALAHQDHRDEEEVRNWKIFYDASDERIDYANVVGFLATPLPHV